MKPGPNESVRFACGVAEDVAPGARRRPLADHAAPAAASFEAGRRSACGLVLDYRDLPEALWGRIPAHFGFVPSPEAVDRMRIVAGRHAKASDRRFAPNGAPKRAAAAPWRNTAARITGDAMTALDAAPASAT